jgi:hypothetical protein
LTFVNLLAARAQLNSLRDSDKLIDAQLTINDKSVDENLRKIQHHYGAEYLEALSHTEFYALYKKHVSAGDL